MYWKLRAAFTPKSPFRWLGSFIYSAEVVALSLVYLVVLSYNAVVLLDPPQLDLTLATTQQNGTYITSVTPGGIMWERGIQAGDRVVALNGRPPGAQSIGYWAG